MKRRARTVLFVALGVLAALVLVVFLWLPWNPFEADAGALDEWVPADVEALVRFDAKGARDAPAVKALWNSVAGRRVRDEYDLDAKLDAVARADAALTDIPFFAGDNPPTVERDLFGGEALVALRGEDVLLLTRISSRAKAIDLICRVREERREDWGIRIEGDAYAADVGDKRSVWFARRRDVLLVATSRELLDASPAVTSGRPSIVGDADYARRRPAAPSGGKASAWLSPPFAERHVAALSILAAPMKRAAAHGVVLDIGLGLPDRVDVTARLDRVGGESIDVSGFADDWFDLDSPGEVFATGALPVRAEDAVDALVRSQPTSRLQLVEDVLAEKGSSISAVAADIARHFKPGLAFVVARLKECDRLKLDEAEGDVVEPIPATVVSFRLADADPEPLLADLRKHAAVLFGPDAQLVEAPSPDRSRWFVSNTSFGPEWELLRPALRVFRDEAVFTTNEAFLRRAGPQGIGRFHERPPTAATAGIGMANLRKRLLDLRWEVADRATRRDWRAERIALRAEIAKKSPGLAPDEMARREDAEIARRIADRERRLFPEAVRRYRDSLRGLETFGGVSAAAFEDGGGWRVELHVWLNTR